MTPSSEEKNSIKIKNIEKIISSLCYSYILSASIYYISSFISLYFRGLIRMSSSDSGWDFTMKTNMSNSSIHGSSYHGSSNSSIHGTNSFNGNSSFHGNGLHGIVPTSSHGSFILPVGYSRSSFGLTNPPLSLTNGNASTNNFHANDDLLRRRVSMSSMINEYKQSNEGKSSRKSLDNSTQGGTGTGVIQKNPGVNIAFGQELLSGSKKKSKSNRTSREASREHMVKKVYFVCLSFYFILYILFEYN